MSALVLSEAGREFIVDATGCSPAALRDPVRVKALVDRLIAEVDLRVVAPQLWHAFPGEGGLTGLVLLAESHVAVHTFPELTLCTINLYCCRPRAPWPWDERLREHLEARNVSVREVERGTLTPGQP